MAITGTINSKLLRTYHWINGRLIGKRMDGTWDDESLDNQIMSKTADSGIDEQQRQAYVAALQEAIASINTIHTRHRYKVAIGQAIMSDTDYNIEMTIAISRAASLVGEGYPGDRGLDS